MNFSDELKKEQQRCAASEFQLKKMESDMVILKQEMENVKSELEGVRTAAAVSEGNKQEEVSNIIQNYQQEVATLQQLLRG